MWQKIKDWQTSFLTQFLFHFYGPPLRQLISTWRLSRRLKYASRKLGFYQSLRSSYNTFPIIDRSVLNEHFAELNSQQLTTKRAQVVAMNMPYKFHFHHSRGNYEQSLFIHNLKEEQKIIKKMLLKQINSHAARVAFFYFTPEPYLPPLEEPQGLQLKFFNLQQNFNTLIKSLAEFNPQAIIAPGQTLQKLTEQGSWLEVKWIIATCERVSPYIQHQVEAYFKLPLKQIYCAAEGWLGSSCAYGTLHLNEDDFYIEKDWIDESKERFVPIITTLYRKLQPLIRYRMEDMLVIEKTPCPCNNPATAIESIHRCQDLLYLPHKSNRHYLKPLYEDSVLKELPVMKEGLMNYQILQHNPRNLTIKLTATDMQLAQITMQQAFSQLCQRFEVQMPNLQFEPLGKPSLQEPFRQLRRE